MSSERACGYLRIRVIGSIACNIVLEQIAAECRRWTQAMPVEITLVVPVMNRTALQPVAVERGDTSTALVVPDRVLRIAIAAGADSFVIAHNHPGNGAPSRADLAVTRRLVAAGAIVGVELIAHLVVTADGWYDCCADPPQLCRPADRAA